MELNTIKAITDFIFVGKEFKDLTYYDLLIINSDWAEKQLADDLKEMRAKGIINEETIFVITASHSGSFTKAEKDTSELLVNYLNDYNFKSTIIVSSIYKFKRDKKHIINNTFEHDFLCKLFDTTK